MGVLSIGLNSINHDDASFEEDNPETIIYVRLIDRHNRFEQCKSHKNHISKEFMPVA